MRGYSQILPTFWTRGSGKALRGDHEAQMLALYLMTCPSANIIGLYYLALPVICHETGMTEDAAREGLKRVSDAGIAFYDEEAELVWIPETCRYQIGDKMHPSDKRRSALIRELATAGSHRFAADFIQRYGKAYQLNVEQPQKEEGASEGVGRGLQAPFSSLLFSSSDRARAEGGRKPPKDSDDETMCPANLALPKHAVAELSKWSGQPEEVIAEAASEFVGYWTIGGGAGKKRNRWLSKLRDDIRRKHHSGRLAEIASQLRKVQADEDYPPAYDPAANQ